MYFTTSPISGVVLIEPEFFTDDRGSFFRTFCGREFANAGLPDRFVQNSISTNPNRGTVRGMHYQHLPSREGKLVRCITGEILDVVIDLRPDSPTYCRRVSYELDVSNGRSVYIPSGVAHGFQTLVNDSAILYQMTEFYSGDLDGGVRWNDSLFAVEWPLTVTTISDRDRTFADYER